MLTGRIEKGVVEYSIKYDLSLYTVSLSSTNKSVFYLTPINQALKLSRLEFSAKNAEERARWYVALTKCMKVNQIESSQNQFIMQNFEPVKKDTLTGTSGFEGDHT